MTRIFAFENEIYPRTLWIAYDDEEAVKECFEEVNGDAINDNISERHACCLPVIQKKDGTQGVIIFYSKLLINKGGAQIVSTISHESVHAANMIMRDIGVHYTKYDDEHFAYLVGWVAKKSWMVLQKYIK